MHIESDVCVMIARLFSVPVIGKIYINTGGAPQIFH